MNYVFEYDKGFLYIFDYLKHLLIILTYYTSISK